MFTIVIIACLFLDFLSFTRTKTSRLKLALVGSPVGPFGPVLGRRFSTATSETLPHERDHLTVLSRNLETEKLRCQSAVSWRRKRQKSFTLQADVVRSTADNLHISRSLDRFKEKDAQLQARCNEFKRHPEPTQFSRDKLEWMQTEEHQPGSAATEVVESSSFVAAGDRLPVHLNTCDSTACPGDTRLPKKVVMVVWRSHNEWRETQLP